MWDAIILTLKLASLTTLVLLLISTPLAWWLTRSTYLGQECLPYGHLYNTRDNSYPRSFWMGRNITTRELVRRHYRFASDLWAALANSPCASAEPGQGTLGQH